MVMRTMRENTKWIMLILTVAFVGWLVFDWVQSGTGQGTATNPTVAVVNGEEIRHAEWNRFLQSRLDQARQQVEGSLSDEERHQAEERAWDQLINQRLIQQELERLGLEATEAEIKQAFRTSPPPGLRNRPEFQTDGQFDIQKYRQFFASGSVDPRLLLQIEQYYRQTIPRMKLQRLVADEVVLTESTLRDAYWRRNATARVRFAALAPSRVADTASVEVTEEEVGTYYREHRDEFSRPRTAVVDVISLDARPSPEDSARARARVDSLRALVGEAASFAALVDSIAREPSGGLRAAEMGPVTPEDLVGPLRDAVFSAPVAELTGPVRTPSGFHLLRVHEREEGEASFSHVLVPVTISIESEDRIFTRMDSIEGIALRSDLETAADSLGLPVRDDVVVEEGSEFVPGAGALGVGVSWAFSADTDVGALSQFFENASGYHLLELDERRPAGTRPLEEVAGQIRDRLRRRALEERARAELEDVVRRIRADETTLESVAEERGWELRTTDTFHPDDAVPGLGSWTPAVGAAFGLEIGRVGGPYAAASGQLAIVELLEKQEPDPQAFQREKNRLRREMVSERRQAHVQEWISALREEATIRDLRDQIGQGQGQGGPGAQVPTM